MKVNEFTLRALTVLSLVLTPNIVVAEQAGLKLSPMLGQIKPKAVEPELIP